MSSFSERLKNIRLVRKLIYATVGIFSYPGLALINHLEIKGTEHLRNLPKKCIICQ